MVTAHITDAPPAAWGANEIQSLKADYPELEGSMDAVSKYNPTPGTGRTGFMNVPPNNYPFYNDDEKYVPVVQADGGQLSGMWGIGDSEGCAVRCEITIRTLCRVDTNVQSNK
jgi:hypothetical protein